MPKEKKHIDFKYLNEATDGNKDAVKKILELFVKNVGENTDKILNALHDKDFNQVFNNAHKAKNELYVVGMNSLADKISEMENNARKNEDISVYAQFISLYIKETQLAVEEVSEILKEIEKDKKI